MVSNRAVLDFIASSAVINSATVVTYNINILFLTVVHMIAPLLLPNRWGLLTRATYASFFRVYKHRETFFS